MKKPKKIAIIGGGAAALLAAQRLSLHHEVQLYEKGKTIGRKFLVAGKGGFNLTNEVLGEELYSNYTPHPILQKALQNFDSQATRAWLLDLGIPTYVGSSGRVFPEKGIKPIEVLQKIKNRLKEQGVKIHCLHEFVGFDNNKKPLLCYNNKTESLEADYYVFALGGASWSVTGSNMDWKAHFEKIGVAVVDFEASNCGVHVNWSADFRKKYAGTPLKNIQLTIGNQSIKGEALITEYGLEGNAIYPIVPSVRTALQQEKKAILYLDLKPNNTLESLLAKSNKKKIATKNYAYALKLSKVQLDLIKEFTSKVTYTDTERFIKSIKGLAIPIEGLRPIEEAISTVGGISMGAINEDFSLKVLPNTFVVGEMLDWDAPTGGFLLQGCFAMAAFLNLKI